MRPHHVAVAIACALAACVPSIARAQEHEHAPGPALGEVDFPVACNPAAQAQFNTLAALLYSFYWERIDDAVAAVLAADPACAMAHWAKAVASLDNALGSPPRAAQERQGWEAVQRAKALGGRTPRERDYIAAVETVFKDHGTVPFPVRAKAYEQALAQLHAAYPGDTEATILYAQWLQVTAERNDPAHAQQLRSARLLEEVFARQPRHPGVAHFLIHAYDFPAIAERGLPAARRYAAIAPDSPHALHMPSHIFSRVGSWQESIDTNLRSHAAARTDRDAFHAMDYLVYALLQLARDDEARKWMDIAGADRKPDEDARQIAYAGAAIPARYALERGDWATAARLDLHPGPAHFNWKAFPEGEAVNAYARGLGAARSGDAPAARVELARLQALRTALADQKKDYWVAQADIQSGALSAWIARAGGHDDEAVALMRAAADREDATEAHITMPGRVIPVREMLGELLLELGQPAPALVAFEQSGKDNPNRFRGLAGAARAAEAAGDDPKAKQYYTRLLALADQDSERDALRRARAYLARR